MTLRHLKIFITVCETGSVTLAGEKLFIAQPSISLAISELEDYYGVKLFDRISKRLHITDIGKQFLQYATHIISLFDEMENTMKNWDAIGTLRVGTSITIGNYLLPNFVDEFKVTHPKIKINALIDNSETIENAVLKNEIDIGFIEGFAHSPYIESQHFMDDDLVLICSPIHPFAKSKIIKIDDLKDVDFIMREKGSAGREIFDDILDLHGIKASILWQSSSTQAIVRAVSHNIGLSVLPYLLIKDSLKRKEISTVDIEGVSLTRKFSIIYHKNKYLTQSANDFINLAYKNHSQY